MRWVRVLAVCVGATAALLASLAVLPMPAGLDAATFCYPFVGPVTRMAVSLDDSTRRLSVAHEAVHAQQCRAHGAASTYLRQAVPRLRAALELEAFCGEAVVERSWGRTEDQIRARILGELRDGYRWFRAIPERQLAATFDATCGRHRNSRY